MEKDMFLDREAAKQQLVEVEGQRMALESEIDKYREAMKAAREHLKKTARQNRRTHCLCKIGGVMPYCTSCGSPIPEGQGKSCSMCYGDIAHGSDGYYQQWAEEQERLHAQHEEDNFQPEQEQED